MRSLASPSNGPLAPTTLVAAGVVVAATLALALFAADRPALVVAPVLGVSIAIFVARAPLRWSANALLFLLLSVDDHAETSGQWRSPLAGLGDALHDRLDSALGVPGLPVTGLEVALVALFAVWLARKAWASEIDGRGPSSWAGVVRDVLVVYVLAVAFSEGLGLLRGQSAVPWKLRNLLHPVLLTALFLAAYRRRSHLVGAAKVVVAAAVLRALLAVVVQRIAIAQTGGEFAVATNHGDSILFSTAGFLVVLNALERRGASRLGVAAATSAVLVAGAVANGRRLVWVMLAGSALFAYAVAPMAGWKRTLSKAVVLAVPIAVLYVAVGWNSSSRVFAPVRTLRGVTDTKVDRSAYWREVENWNIAVSIREHPVLGTGLGGEYTEFMANDDVSVGFKEYREWPHNTILGQILLLGILGFSATTALPALAIFLGVRSYRRARDATDRTVALGSCAAVIACLVMAWGDTGAHYTQYKLILALAAAASAVLAAETGAWPGRTEVAAGRAAAGSARG